MTERLGTRLLAVFVLATLALVLVEPGHVPLFDPDEGRYAEIPREMLASGDWVTPRLNGVLYFEKPPLHYWSVALSFKLLGPTEAAARLPTKLATAGMMLAAFLYARRRYGTRTALVAALITGSAGLVFCLGRINVIDPSLSLSLSAAAFAFAAYQEAEALGEKGRARRALYGLHVACAAAVMLKGLIGLVLPGGAILVWAALVGRWRLVPRLFSPGPLVTFLVLVVPWHVLVAQRNPSFLQFYFVHEHFDRFARSEHRREAWFGYFVPVILAGLLPWTAFLGGFREVWPGRRLAAWRERQGEAFLVVFSILVFAFFSVSRSKLIPYVEPIFPVLAVLLAVGLSRSSGDGVLQRRFTAGLFLAMLVVAAVYGYGLGWVRELGIQLPAALVVAGLLAGAVLNLAPRPGGPGALGREANLVLVAGPWLLFLTGALAALPGVSRAITSWPVVSTLLREARESDLVVQRGVYIHTVAFYMRQPTPISNLGWSELDFGRANPHASGLFQTEEEWAATWGGARRVFCVVHRNQVPELRLERAAPGHAPRQIGRMKRGKILLFVNRAAP